MSRRIAGAPRVVQRALESSCSPIGIRERVVAVAVAIAVAVAVVVAIVVVIVVCSVSRRVTLTRKLVFPLFTGLCNSSSGVLETCRRARVVEKKFRGSCRRGELGIVERQKCASVRIGRRPLLRSRSMGAGCCSSISVVALLMRFALTFH